MKSNFRLPGPTPVPPEVYAAMQGEMLPHRGAEFSAFYQGMLAAVCAVSTDRVRCAGLARLGFGRVGRSRSPTSCRRGMKSSQWWRERLATDLRLSPASLVWWCTASISAWGARDSSTKSCALRSTHIPTAKAVFLTHNETSTGVTHPIPELAAVARERGVLTLVDGVSSVAGVPLEFDAWDIDYLFSGPAKSLDVPTGGDHRGDRPARLGSLRAIFFSQVLLGCRSYARSRRGWAHLDHPAGVARFRARRRGADDRRRRAGERLGASRGAGRANARRHRSDRPGTRWPSRDSNRTRSPLCMLPEGLSSKAVVKRLSDEYGVTVAGGQAHLADRSSALDTWAGSIRTISHTCLAAVKAVLG